MAQLVTRVDDELAQAVDELVAAGVVPNRSEAVRLGLKRLVDRHRRDAVGASIVAGYVAAPQFDDLQPIRRSFLTERVGELGPPGHQEICRALRAFSDCSPGDQKKYCPKNTTPA